VSGHMVNSGGADFNVSAVVLQAGRRDFMTKVESKNSSTVRPTAASQTLKPRDLGGHSCHHSVRTNVSEMSSLARTLGSWIRIQLKAWMFGVCMRLFCVCADHASKESYRL
jgi:hypothetical protein